MPVIFRSGGLRFFFYSDEGAPREPPHIHVRQGDREAKLWLRSGLPQAYNYGFSPRELRDLRELERSPFKSNHLKTVMTGLVPVIHVDPRVKPGDDGLGDVNGTDWTPL